MYSVHGQVATTLNNIEHKLRAAQHINQCTLDYYLERYTHQLRNYHTNYKKPKLQQKLDALIQHKPESTKTSHVPCDNRVTCVNVELKPTQRETLRLGPNFAVKEINKKDILKSAERGCERFNYGYRYHHMLDKNNELSNTRPLKFPSSSNEYKPPAPTLHSCHETRLRETKNSILTIYKEAINKPRTSNITNEQKLDLDEL